MKLIEMSWPDLAAVTQGDAPVAALLPVAAIEQHGPHLAVSTDTALVTAVAERVEAQFASQVVLCPTLFVGSSHHHFGFGGTLSLSPELYSRVLVELMQSLLKDGFRRIVLLNGHGGNIIPGKQAITMLEMDRDNGPQPNIVFATYWEMAERAFYGEAPMETPAISHACEYETSMMLNLYPERVRLDRAERASVVPAGKFISWENEGPFRGVSMGWRTHFVSSNGSSGQPQLATAAKGEHLLERAVGAATDFMADFLTWPFLDDRRVS